MIYLLLLFTCSPIHIINAGSSIRTSFDPFRALTNQFLNTVQPNSTALQLTQALIFNATDQLPMSSDPMYYLNMYWNTYPGYIVLLVIGILFLIFFPLVGFFFCICRLCCKKCGAKSNSGASVNMKSKRIAFNVFLFILTTLILIGAIVAMASNFVFIESLKASNETSDPDGNLINNINLTVIALNNTISLLNQNIVVNGGNVIKNTINQAIMLFNAVIVTFINTFQTEINFNQLVNSTSTFIQNYQKMESLLNTMSNTSSQHQTQANNFSSYLNNVSNELTNILSNNNTCANITSCTNVINQLPNLVIGFNISNINYTVDQQAANLSNSYNVSDIQNSMNKIINGFANVTSNVNSSFSNFISNLINTVNGSNLIPNFVTFVNSNIAVVSTQISNIQQQYLSNSTIVSTYYPYVNYAFYGLCGLISVVLLVILLFFIGLFYGVCGVPSFEDTACCNRGVGSGFLMASVAISFIFGWLIMLITMIMFFSGGICNTEICSYLNTTDTNKIQTVDNFVNHYIQKNPVQFGAVYLPNLNFYQSLMLRCPNSTDFLSSFQIPQAFMQNISNVIYTNYVDGPINTTIANINNYSVPALDTSSFDDSIKNITTSIQQLMSVVSRSTILELSKPVILVVQNDFWNSIYVLYNDLNNLNRTSATNNISNALSAFNSTIQSMTSIQNLYNTQKNASDASIKLVNSTFQPVVTHLAFLKSQPSNAKNKAVSTSQNQLKTSAQNIINSTLYNLFLASGNCQGISTVFNMAVYSFCVVVLGPFNNVWMGLGWFLLFIIPAIIFAVKLNGIYKISYIESDFAAYNSAYMTSNQFLSKSDLEMIR